MNIFIGGARGTSVTAVADRLKYGGNTTSILVEGAAGERVILDLGTGVAGIARRLEQEGRRPLQVLMTHYHLDHIMGFPHFSLLYREGQQMQISAPAINGLGPGDVLPRLVEPPIWPVTLDDMGAHVAFHTWGASPVACGGLAIRWVPLHHPDGCVAYRVDEPSTGAACVLATDVEWQLSTAEEREALLELCRAPAPARLLLFDAQFTDAEYPKYRGWGHSTWTDAVEVARAGRVENLRAIHHAPWRRDAELDEYDRHLQEQWPGARVGREGEEIAL